LGDVDADRMDNIKVDVDIKDDIKLKLRGLGGYDMECRHLALDRDLRLAL
jgi:hypothetical protein